MFHTDARAIAYVDVEAGAELPEHVHAQDEFAGRCV